MDITPLTSDTQRGSSHKGWKGRVDDEPGDGGTEERMCDAAAAGAGSGHLGSQSGKLSAAPVSLLRRTFTCVTRFK